MTHDVPFSLICNKTNKKYGYMFAKVMDPNTLVIEKYGNRSNIDMGVYIDVFPLDGLGDTKEEAVKSLRKINFLHGILIASNWKKFFRSKTRPIYYEPIRFAFFCLSRVVSYRKLINKAESKYDFDSFDKSKYVGCVCGSYGVREILEYETVSEYEDVVFEGTTFKGPKHYDKFLTGFYGDYMQLPPVEKRVTHHTFDALYKE